MQSEEVRYCTMGDSSHTNTSPQQQQVQQQGLKVRISSRAWCSPLPSLNPLQAGGFVNAQHHQKAAQCRRSVVRSNGGSGNGSSSRRVSNPRHGAGSQGGGFPTHVHFQATAHAL